MSDDLNADYSKLLERSRELAILQSAGSILHWDMETKMPPRGIHLRSEQLGLLQKIGHEMLTDPENGKLIESIRSHGDYDGLGQVKKRNVHLAKKAYDEETKLPVELVTDIAKQQTLATATWKRAKAAKNYDMFKPDLKKMRDLQAKAADILMEVKETKTPYDALIDIYEPKMTAEAISKLFDEMGKGLKAILGKIMQQEKPDTSFLTRPVPAETQAEIAENLAAFINYDTKSEKASGRIDTTEHPFTTGYYQDVRITTNYHVDYFPASVFSVLHEGGHALYELGLPDEWIYQPIGSSCSMGVHESMSRFVENHVGRSPQFWEYYMPVLKKLTGDTLKDVDAIKMMRAVNYVTPSKIRIEADEVTYGLHIIIRFEMERDMFNGDLSVDELPQVWNQKYKKYLGLDIENDSEGVMQDTHWASGLFGYFPSYALGNLYDGLWRQKLTKDNPDWLNQIKRGDFSQVKTWLTNNVYRYANLYDPEDLVKEVTGNELAVKPFIDYLEDKFKKVYGY
jgi:carboxypeptidase Taq